MNRTLVALLLLLLATPATARHYRKAKKAYVPRNNAATANLGLGGMCGYAAVKGGVEYQRFFTPEGMISVAVGAEAYTGGTIRLGGAHDGQIDTRTSGGYIYPAIRFHPMGNTRRVDLSLGIALPMGKATSEEKRYDSYYSPVKRETTSFLGAVLFQFQATFRSSRGPLVGPYLNAGYTYSDTRPVLSDDTRSPLVLMIGVRFGGQW